LSDDRTPHWLIQLRFLGLCSPVGIILAIILAPWAIFVLPAFFGTLFVFWQASRLFTNGFVKFFDPEAHNAIKQSGGDPFYDSLGTPLNNDREDVRMCGHEPNQGNETDEICPECWEPVFIQLNTNTVCPHCNAHWHNNQWWKWDGVLRASALCRLCSSHDF